MDPKKIEDTLKHVETSYLKGAAPHGDLHDALAEVSVAARAIFEEQGAPEFVYRSEAGSIHSMPLKLFLRKVVTAGSDPYMDESANHYRILELDRKKLMVLVYVNKGRPLRKMAVNPMAHEGVDQMVSQVVEIARVSGRSLGEAVDFLDSATRAAVFWNTKVS